MVLRRGEPLTSEPAEINIKFYFTSLELVIGNFDIYVKILI